MRDTKSLLLILLSIGLVSTWIYHLYDKTIYSRQPTETPMKDSAAIVSNMRDSLQKTYTSTVQNFNTGIDSSNRNISNTDSLNKNNQLNAKLAEISNLKNDISTILNKAGATSSELEIAQQKIILLQQKAEELRNDKTVMEAEKKRMIATLEKVVREISEIELNVKKLDTDNKSLAQKVTLASAFTASKLQLIAMSSDGNSDQKTSEAGKTEKFVLSLVVQNSAFDFNDAELYVVIIKPDGQVLQSQQAWESGSFNTLNGSKKNYTAKMRFDYNKGEPKELRLAINAENCQKGSYWMQVYHSGILIGQIAIKLN